jgi:hypothetical protein
MTRAAWPLLMLLAGCASDPAVDLAVDQGPCTNLDEATCRLDARCQQAYVDSAFSIGPAPLRCLRLDGATTATTACAALDRDGCRARADCSPLFWQDLGPTDGPVGDPYFKACQAELSP